MLYFMLCYVMFIFMFLFLLCLCFCFYFFYGKYVLRVIGKFNLFVNSTYLVFLIIVAINYAKLTLGTYTTVLEFSCMFIFLLNYYTSGYLMSKNLNQKELWTASWRAATLLVIAYYIQAVVFLPLYIGYWNNYIPTLNVQFIIAAFAHPLFRFAVDFAFRRFVFTVLEPLTRTEVNGGRTLRNAWTLYYLTRMLLALHGKLFIFNINDLKSQFIAEIFSTFSKAAFRNFAVVFNYAINRYNPIINKSHEEAVKFAELQRSGQTANQFICADMILDVVCIFAAPSFTYFVQHVNLPAIVTFPIYYLLVSGFFQLLFRILMDVITIRSELYWLQRPYRLHLNAKLRTFRFLKSSIIISVILVALLQQQYYEIIFAR